jgi:hypothetical protein
MGLNWDSNLGAHRADYKTLDLHQIDLGPVDRAGIPSLSAVPVVTSEMIKGDDKPMDKLQIIRVMTADEADLLPKPVRDAITASVQPPPEVALVQELRGELGDGDILETVREWKTERDNRAKTAVTDRITELVNDKETGVKVEVARPLVMELIKARSPQTAAEAETAYKAVIESETVMELLKSHVTQKGGPPLRMGVQGQSNGKYKYMYPPTEESA